MLRPCGRGLGRRLRGPIGLSEGRRRNISTIVSSTRQRDQRLWQILPTSTSRTSTSLREFNSTVRMQEDAPTVSFNLVDRDGNSTKIHIYPSYPHKPKAIENLLKSLPPLLTEATMPISAIKSFGTRGWDLDEAADTIHRYVVLQNNQDATKIVQEIDTVAKELNHDPHIHVDNVQMTISCTTHVPPGLSMKDVKLAKRIDEVLSRSSISTSTTNPVDEAEILTQRQRGREHNMGAIKKAKSSCSCG